MNKTVAAFKRNWLFAVICGYSFFAIFITVLMESQKIREVLPLDQHFPWEYYLFIGSILLLQFISTIGLWLKQQWAFIVLFLFFLFQSLSFAGGKTNFYFIVGPHLFINLKLALSDGVVIIGLNVLAITLAILLLLTKNK